MKIMPITTGVNKWVKSLAAASMFMCTAPIVSAQGQPEKDVFVSNQEVYTSKGIDIKSSYAVPDPLFYIDEKPHFAAIVVDAATNVLYHYDESGKPIKGYEVASSKKRLPILSGLRMISKIEPNTVTMDIIDYPIGKSGKSDIQLIHGTNKKHAPKGSIKMDDKAINELTNQLKEGQYVIIQ